jgi:hypothetical protein
MESSVKKQLVATATDQRPVRGRPFPPGVSGNPAGRRTQKQRIAERYEILASEFKNPACTPRSKPLRAPKRPNVSSGSTRCLPN